MNRQHTAGAQTPEGQNCKVWPESTRDEMAKILARLTAGRDDQIFSAPITPDFESVNFAAVPQSPEGLSFTEHFNNSRADDPFIDAFIEDGQIELPAQNQYNAEARSPQAAENVKQGQATALTASIAAGTVNIFSTLSKVQSGQITVQQAEQLILADTAAAACNGARKATGKEAEINSEQMSKMLVSSSVTSSLSAVGVSGTGMCAADLVHCLALTASGKMPMSELKKRFPKNAIKFSSVSVGSIVGGVVGSAAGPFGALVGKIAGGMICSMTSTIAIENHIERPYKEAAENAEQLYGAVQSFAQLTKSIAEGQRLFQRFLETENVLRRQTEHTLKENTEKGKELKNLIDMM